MQATVEIIGTDGTTITAKTWTWTATDVAARAAQQRLLTSRSRRLIAHHGASHAVVTANGDTFTVQPTTADDCARHYGFGNIPRTRVPMCDDCTTYPAMDNGRCQHCQGKPVDPDTTRCPDCRTAYSNDHTSCPTCAATSYSVYQLTPEDHGMFRVKGNLKTRQEADEVAAYHQSLRPVPVLVARLVDLVMVETTTIDAPTPA